MITSACVPTAPVVFVQLKCALSVLFFFFCFCLDIYYSFKISSMLKFFNVVTCRCFQIVCLDDPCCLAAFLSSGKKKRIVHDLAVFPKLFFFSSFFCKYPLWLHCDCKVLFIPGIFMVLCVCQGLHMLSHTNAHSPCKSVWFCKELIQMHSDWPCTESLCIVWHLEEKKWMLFYFI